MKNFLDAQKIQIDILLDLLKEKGQRISDDFESKSREEQLKEVGEPSVFDDDAIKDMKLTLQEIGEYIKECIDAAKI